MELKLQLLALYLTQFLLMVTNTCNLQLHLQDSRLDNTTQVSYYHLKFLLLINAQEFYHFPQGKKLFFFKLN